MNVLRKVLIRSYILLRIIREVVCIKETDILLRIAVYVYVIYESKLGELCIPLRMRKNRNSVLSILLVVILSYKDSEWNIQ